MKIIRSSQCSIKYSTKLKQKQLKLILNEYKNTVNFFIDLFYENPISKAELLKDIVNSSNSWFSHRMKKTAAREALDMLKSSYAICETKREELLEKANRTEIEKQKNKYITNANNLKPKKPKHHGKIMCISSTIAELQLSKTEEFDAWLHLSSIGNKIQMNIPIKFQKHYNELQAKGQRLNYYIITKDYIQFCFKIETGPKRERKQTVGLDTGVKSLAVLSTGDHFGEDIENIIKKINNCKYGSKKQKKLRNHLKQRMNEVSKEIVNYDEIDCIVVEKLNSINKNSKKSRKKSKEFRKVIGIWAYRYWLDKIKRDCEENRVYFRSVYPYNTSITCSNCGHADKRNRKSQDIFKCLRCGYTNQADENAAINIRDRFLIGTYGSDFQPLDQIKIL